MPPSPDLPADAVSERDPEDLVEVAAYSSNTSGFEHGLVVLALGRPFWLMPSASGFRLMVEAHAAEAVRHELACFDREAAMWQVPAAGGEAAATRRVDFATPLVWAFAEVASFQLQATRPGWTEQARLDAAALFSGGDGWRPFSALFVQADVGHLVSNLLSGVFVFSAVLAVCGRLRGWLLLLVGAVAGNVAAAAVHQGDSYRSLGASTAVFAALGLLTGAAVRRVVRTHGAARWRPVLLPLGSGLVVLALFGAGDVHIDVVAHTTGFAAGLALGLLVGEEGANKASRGPR